MIKWGKAGPAQVLVQLAVAGTIYCGQDHKVTGHEGQPQNPTYKAETTYNNFSQKMAM